MFQNFLTSTVCSPFVVVYTIVSSCSMFNLSVRTCNKLHRKLLKSKVLQGKQQCMIILLTHFYYFTLRPTHTHSQTRACAGCKKGSEDIVLMLIQFTSAIISLFKWYQKNMFSDFNIICLEFTVLYDKNLIRLELPFS